MVGLYSSLLEWEFVAAMAFGEASTIPELDVSAYSLLRTSLLRYLPILNGTIDS